MVENDEESGWAAVDSGEQVDDGDEEEFGGEERGEGVSVARPQPKDRFDTRRRSPIR